MPRAEIKMDLSSLGKTLSLMEFIDAKIKRRGMKKALDTASKILVESAKSKVRRDHSVLYKSLGSKTKVKITAKNQFGFSVIGAARRAGQKIAGVEKIPTKYAHLVEYGTAAHTIGKKNHPGARPFPFLRNSWDTNKNKVLDVIEKILSDTINEGSA